MLGLGRIFTALVAGAILLPAALRADEVVYLSSEGESRQSGEIVDYTGRELRIRALNGREVLVAASKVKQISFERRAEHSAADRLAAEGKFAEASRQYARALEGEVARPWVQRLIASRAAVCEAQLPPSEGGIERAGNLVLAVLRNDPDSPYFAALPLQWATAIPLPALEKKAEEWLNSEMPAARLLGASWLLQSARRGTAAQQVLDALTREKDPRIALLADAQLWRKIAMPTEINVERMQATIARLDPRLRAGPYFLLGKTLASLKQTEPAALALMRVPVDFPDEGPLAAEALVLAGKQLALLDRPDQAKGLWHEAVTRHAGTIAAAEAEELLKDTK